MPNMDDISFWDSTPYAHRGGLWSDAARTEKQMTTVVEEENARVSVTTGVSKEPTSPPPILRTDSLATEVLSSDALSILRPEPTIDSSDTSPQPRRTQSWLGMGEESDHEGATAGDDSGNSRGRRSRATSSALREEGNVTPSANATASASDVLDDEHDIFRYLSPQYSPRSSSAHSRSSRTHSISSSTGDECNPLSDSSAPSTSRGPRHSFGAVTTTGSLLSTLKSKAGDKQTLSTARETIRKWGVNWATLRKDMGRTGMQEEMADSGPTYQRTRTESTHNRASYADVRAAVTARREQQNHFETEHNGSLPIPIPQTGSPSALGRPGSSSAGSSSGKNSEGVSRSPGMTLSRSGGDQTCGPLYDHDFRDDLDDHPDSSPIHTQPSQARTMTIPGIHASHRGEIMSMGNIAASPPSPENKLKTTTIQNMYRLWKSPTLSGQQQGAESQTSSDIEGKKHHDEDVTPFVLSSEPTPPPSKPVPPPLPPRTASAVPTAPIRPAAEVAETPDPADEVPMRSAPPILTGSGDEQVDGSTPSRMRNAESRKPPLPPRRIHA